MATDATTTLVSAFYYLLVFIMAVISLFALSVLLRFGQNKTLSLTVVVVFCLLFIGLFGHSYHLLQGLAL